MSADPFQNDLDALADAITAGATALILKHPDRRKTVACVALGAAIAIADSVGEDVEGFTALIRENSPKPPVLVPPKGAAS